MHVLINAASAHMGGAVTFLQNVLPALGKVAYETKVSVVLPAATRDRLSFGDSQRLNFITYPHLATSGYSRMHFDQVEIPRMLDEVQADVLFSSTGFGTFRSNRPQVLLVRNMAYFDAAFHDRYRQLGRSLWRNRVRRWHSLVSAKTSDVVLFPSQAIRDSVLEYVHLRPEATEVLHYGFDHERFAKAASSGSAFGERVRDWKADGYAILLNVSTFAVQKNFETLLEALALIARRGRKFKFLTTISRDKTTDTAEYDSFYERARELSVVHDIVELGYVPYEELGSLYRLADLYVFPSFSESFGHSLVEAMAAGIPVVAADSAVNKEVCLDAAGYFPSFEAEGCALVIGDLLDNSEKRERMSRTAIDRSRHFSWDEYARALNEIFHRVVDRNASRTTEMTVQA